WFGWCAGREPPAPNSSVMAYSFLLTSTVEPGRDGLKRTEIALAVVRECPRAGRGAITRAPITTRIVTGGLGSPGPDRPGHRGARLTGQHDADGRAATLGVLDGDGATVFGDHLLDDGQPEPGTGHGPRGGGAVEALEHQLPLLRRDPRPCVVDGQLEQPAAGFAHAHTHLLPRRAPLGGIVEHVEDGALQRGVVAVDEPRPQLGDELDVGATAAGP